MTLPTDDLNAILGALVRLELPEAVDPYHDCAEHHQLTLEGAADRVLALMEDHPHMVAGLRAALTDVIEEAQDQSKSKFCDARDVEHFYEDLHAIGGDVEGTFAREAADLRRAEARAADLGQRESGRPGRARRRS